ncbi:hypothetical protein LMG3410_04888 [Achromobacter aegrifaciens]|uniref:hypothetical protein n=1 Tax=Achromobacter aegrifaciens TaxID=1287736 RepID=UPI0014670502|nr:hypothetical protein [Achromobacter aegrifaciens]CAB3912105.1 hypothetical protein LMG3410_04888 [Achromobacter aegrifaciens]
MEKLHEWCLCRHPRLARALRVLYAWALVLGILCGGFAVGSLVTWQVASQAIAQQRDDYREALAAVAAAVSRAAGTAEQAAETAERAAGSAAGAVQAAKGAASKAGSAATKANAAAASASSVVRKAEKALPQVTGSHLKEVPEWLDTP